MKNFIRTIRRAAFVSSATLLLAAAASAQSAASAASSKLVVHEWGTFTSLHDENGEAIGGINADDEPVPKFVHRIADFLVIGPHSVPALVKGAPHCHPHATMRLETPVVYFHPPAEARLPMNIDVEVEFHGGWLSEYYPDALAEAPGVKGQMSFGPITPKTVGRLRWSDLQVGTEAAGPETTSNVWLMPRAVDAANVTTADGQSERYLFYRGVGNVDSPLQVSRDPADQSLIITANFQTSDNRVPADYAVPVMWIVEVRDDKSCAFHQLDGFQVTSGDGPTVVARTPGEFDDAEFDSDNTRQLAADMRGALIDDGLYADEADALLNTWKLSYFESPGLRLFYLLPRQWTDRVLPMRLSAEADLVRTMVGRIEILTPRQRQLLGRISAGPASTAQWMFDQLRSDRSNPSADAPLPPADYVAYQQLGRFGNALLLDELQRRPTAALKTFVDGYGLRGFTPSDLAAAPVRAKK